MNDADRWINLEGPPPPGLREMLDAGRAVPPPSPELAAELDRRLFAAIAEKRARKARERRVKVGIAAGLLVGGVAAVAAALALLAGPVLGRDPAPNAIRPIPAQRGSATRP